MDDDRRGRTERPLAPLEQRKTGLNSCWAANKWIKRQPAERPVLSKVREPLLSEAQFESYSNVTGQVSRLAILL